MTDRRDVHTYLDPEVADEVEARSEADGESVSAWVAGAVHQRLKEDRLGSSADRYEIERRLERVVDRAADRAADRIVDQISRDTDQPDPDTTDEKVEQWGES